MKGWLLPYIIGAMWIHYFYENTSFKNFVKIRVAKALSLSFPKGRTGVKAVYLGGNLRRE